MLILQGVSISNQKGQENPNFEVLPFNKRKMCARYNIVPVSTYLSWEDYQDLGTKWVNHLYNLFILWREPNLGFRDFHSYSFGRALSSSRSFPWKVVVGRLLVFGNFQGCNLSGQSGYKKIMSFCLTSWFSTHFLKLWKTANYIQAEAMVLACVK